MQVFYDNSISGCRTTKIAQPAGISELSAHSEIWLGMTLLALRNARRNAPERVQH
jgi:hypothetical protein